MKCPHFLLTIYVSRAGELLGHMSKPLSHDAAQLAFRLSRPPHGTAVDCIWIKGRKPRVPDGVRLVPDLDALKAELAPMEQGALL